MKIVNKKLVYYSTVSGKVNQVAIYIHLANGMENKGESLEVGD